MAIELAALELGIYETGTDKAIADLTRLEAAGQRAAGGYRAVEGAGTKVGDAVKKTSSTFEELEKTTVKGEFGLGRLERGMVSLGVTAAGLSGESGHVAHLVAILASLGEGGAVALGVIGTLTAVSLLMERLGAASKEAAKQLAEARKEAQAMADTPAGKLRTREETLQTGISAAEAALKGDIQKLVNTGMTEDRAMQLIAGPDKNLPQVSGILEVVEDARKQIDSLKQDYILLGNTTKGIDKAHEEDIKKAAALDEQAHKVAEEYIRAEMDLNRKLIADLKQFTSGERGHGPGMANAAGVLPVGPFNLSIISDLLRALGQTPGGGIDSPAGDARFGVRGPAAATSLKAFSKTLDHDLKVATEAANKASKEYTEGKRREEEELRKTMTETGKVIKDVGRGLVAVIEAIQSKQGFWSLVGKLLGVAGGIMETVGFATLNPGLMEGGAGLAAGGSVIGALGSDGGGGSSSGGGGHAGPGPTVGQGIRSAVMATMGAGSFQAPVPAPAMNITVIGPNDPSAQRDVSRLIGFAARRGF